MGRSPTRNEAEIEISTASVHLTGKVSGKILEGISPFSPQLHLLWK